MKMLEPILFCWSGGKDSAMALHTLLQQKHFRIVALLTTVTETYDRIAMHGVRCELLRRQAESLRLPLHESFFHDLPPHADPCGENGEFHTFVFDGSIFQSPIPVRTGDVVNRDGFVFCDLLLQMEEATK